MLALLFRAASLPCEGESGEWEGSPGLCRAAAGLALPLPLPFPVPGAGLASRAAPPGSGSEPLRVVVPPRVSVCGVQGVHPATAALPPSLSPPRQPSWAQTVPFFLKRNLRLLPPLQASRAIRPG